MSNNYCAVSAKLKAMYSTCLKDTDYKNLLMKKSVADICGYLKSETEYGELLESITDKNAHRGAVELILENYLYDQYIRLYNFMTRPQRKVLKLWLMRREIEYLKRNIRNVFNGENINSAEKSIDASNAFFIKHTKINCGMINSAKNFEEFIEACKDTIYYDLLKTAGSINSDYFSIGMMLDSLYYTQLWNVGAGLPTNERHSFEQFVGSTIDMLNITWIYRGKKYFQFPSEIVYTYLIPVRHRLSEETVKAMVESKNAAEIPEILKDSMYAPLFKDVSDLYFIEENLMRLENKLAKRIFVNYPLSIAAAFAYLNLKQTEIYKITVVIEGIRYNMDSKIIERHLEGLVS